MRFTQVLSNGDYAEQTAISSAGISWMFPSWLSFFTNLLSLSDIFSDEQHDPSGRLLYIEEGYSVVTIDRVYIGRGYSASEREYYVFNKEGDLCYHDTIGVSYITD